MLGRAVLKALRPDDKQQFPVPVLEVGTVAGWTRLSAVILPRVRVPGRLTFAEHEAWWRHDD
jgi:hypothetical protein